MDQRELTREERAAIRALVVKWCANYDRAVGCLPLDCECYMLGKTWRRPALLDGRRRYCSPACAQAAHRKQQRDHMRKKRG